MNCFKKAGYRLLFLNNQFLMEKGEKKTQKNLAEQTILCRFIN